MSSRAVLGTVATLLVMVVGCSNAASQEAGHGDDDGVLAAEGVIAKSELLGVTTLEEVAAASTVVVGGKVASTSLEPLGSDDDALGYIRVTLDVSRSYKGDVGRQVDFLMLGYEPARDGGEGTVLRAEEEHWIDPGDEGMWFLQPTEVPEFRDDLFVTTSAGQVLKQGSHALTGGNLQASAILCRVPWSEATALVEEAVARSTGVAPLEPTELSPHHDPTFAGNPCAPTKPEPITSPTEPEGT
jgi:hypothetical protein